MSNNSHTSASSICLITVLYILQGMNLGLTASIPLFLAARGASWKDQGTFNFTIYPFSLKLIWAPLIDALYSVRFGRRKSWLVPIQLSMAAIFFFLSFYVESFIAARQVILLTVIFFFIVFLTATQDICVDGLAISLFAATNSQWASTSQTVGQALGRFIGSSLLLTLESANFTNRFIREPLSLPTQPSGLFSLEQFIRCVALAFLIVTMCLAVFYREPHEVANVDGEETNTLPLAKTYLAIFKLLKKKCIRQLNFVSLLSPVGLVAIRSMTQVALVSQGVPRANVGLVNIPAALVAIMAPLFIRHTERPLVWFAGSYLLCLISAIPIAAYVYFTPWMISSIYYYPMLILLLTFNQFIMMLRISSQIGFFASICQPSIGGTYMALLFTLLNLGFSLNSSAVLYAANWLPKRYAFAIAVSVGVVLGILWLGCAFDTLKRLQKLPIHKWYLKSEAIKNDPTKPDDLHQNDHGVLLVHNKEID